MHAVLHRIGFVYKKTKVIPGKADRAKQEGFVEIYKELKEGKEEEDPIYFMDGVHPQHNTMAAYGWILKGEDKEIKSNTGRQRLNLNGAVNVESHEIIIREDPSLNAQSSIALFEQLEERNPEAQAIHVIADNASYYRSRVVKNYLETSKIQLIFLPPYSPNLNLIERVWKFFKKKVLYNQYYESFAEFKTTCLDFFAKMDRHKSELKTLLTENFQFVGT